MLCNLAEGYLLANCGSEASHAATRALELARSRKEKGNEAWALHMVGEVSCNPDLDGSHAAEARYGEALALASEKVQRALDGAQVRKVIVVPDRLVNLVA